uniref:Uncharacterized protein n=1 Tax=Setaria italica TaxID=4555 RepID=K3ZYI0_SETIT
MKDLGTESGDWETKHLPINSVWQPIYVLSVVSLRPIITASVYSETLTSRSKLLYKCYMLQKGNGIKTVLDPKRTSQKQPNHLCSVGSSAV